MTEVQVGDWVVVTEGGDMSGGSVGEMDQVARLDPGCRMGLYYDLQWWGWVRTVRPATQEELARAQLASLEGL